MLKGNDTFESIEQLHQAIKDGRTTAEAVVQQCLQVIKDLDPQINAVTAINNNALEQARRLDVSTDICCATAL